MGHVLVVANLAATFGGNFVESLVALQTNVSGGVTYVLPEEAKGASGWRGSVMCDSPTGRSARCVISGRR